MLCTIWLQHDQSTLASCSSASPWSSQVVWLGLSFVLLASSRQELLLVFNQQVVLVEFAFFAKGSTQS